MADVCVQPREFLNPLKQCSKMENNYMMKMIQGYDSTNNNHNSINQKCTEINKEESENMLFAQPIATELP